MADKNMDSTGIYAALREEIIHLERAPESVLNLSDLARDFNVSRTPIKEALIALESEEWITRQGSHFIITPLSLERIREITEIRMVMEVQANLWAMERMTPPELDGLLALKKQIKTLNPAATNKDIVDFDFTIHHYIFKAAKNVNLARILERILSHYLRFWLSIPRQIDQSVFFIEARELIAALQARDADAVRECTTRHIRNSVAEIMGTR